MTGCLLGYKFIGCSVFPTLVLVGCFYFPSSEGGGGGEGGVSLTGAFICVVKECYFLTYMAISRSLSH